MKVVHWNLHHGGVGSDGKLNVGRITSLLVGFAPDVVSLNEVEQLDGYGNTDQVETHRQALEVAQGRPWFSSFVQLNGGGNNKGIGAALLSSFPIAASERYALYGGRPALYASQPFGALYTTHPDPNSGQHRNVQLSQQLCWHKTHEALNGKNLVACGDFNTTPTSIEIAPWPVWYKDAWVESHKLGTATSFKPEGITHGVHRIDYIWYRGLTVVSCDVPDTSVNGVFPSDHHPVIAVFK
jgi:endonuclease/exonuclease/phosphatase family metal-dependent hydrolase